jgi:hypothetical protein
MSTSTSVMEGSVEYVVLRLTVGMRSGTMRLADGRLRYTRKRKHRVVFDAPVGEFHSLARSSWGTGFHLWHGATRHRFSRPPGPARRARARRARLDRGRGPFRSQPEGAGAQSGGGRPLARRPRPGGRRAGTACPPRNVRAASARELERHWTTLLRQRLPSFPGRFRGLKRPGDTLPVTGPRAACPSERLRWAWSGRVRRPIDRAGRRARRRCRHRSRSIRAVTPARVLGAPIDALFGGVDAHRRVPEPSPTPRHPTSP